jgi:membrane associated rhomboid family serine protease
VVGLAFALAVLASHAFAHLLLPAELLERGAADAEQIVRGEWWRAVTALTLHADAAHAGGNALIGGLAVALLAHRLGPAAAAWVTLLAGAVANFTTALIHRSGHVAIGASGAVFGALGALAAAQLGTSRGARRGRPWLALAASAALLGFLGTSKNSDLLAHAFGMLAGLLLGALAAPALRVPPRRRALQPALAALALLAVAGCWWLMLKQPLK